MSFNKLTYLRRDFNKWSILTLTIVGFIVVPLITIFINLFNGPGETWTHIVKNLLFEYTINTIWLICGCTLLSLFLGVSSAWIVSRYNIPFIKMAEWMLILPLVIPSYITAYAYAGFFDYGGAWFRIVNEVFKMETTKVDIMSLTGLIIVLSVSLFPYIYVSCRALFIFQSSRLIEASKLLGASESRTFFKIVLPLARPAIVGGLILVIMEVLNDYGAAKYYGVNTFTTGIFRSWFALNEPQTAVYLSALLLLIVFIFIALERWQRGSRKYTFSSKNEIRLSRVSVSKGKQIAYAFIVFTPILLGFLIPFFQLLYWSVLTFDRVATQPFLFIAGQSLGIAFLAALVTVLLALMMLNFSKWNTLRILKKSPRIAILGYAIPGAVIAIGVMLPFLKIDKWLIGVLQSVFDTEIGLVFNGTILILLYAYAIRYMAVAFNPIDASRDKIQESLIEASQLLGKNKVKTFFNIELPMLKTGIVGGFILVFVDVMKELPLTLILKPYNVNTLAVKAYEFASDELIMEAAIPSLCIIAVGIIPIILLNRLILK